MKKIKTLSLFEYITNNFGFETAGDWLLWPPNTFAVTSDILSKTGAYRYVLYKGWEEKEQIEGQKRQEYLEEQSKFWVQRVCEDISNLFDFKRRSFDNNSKDYLITITKNIHQTSKSINFNQLRVVNQEKNTNQNNLQVKELIVKLINLHCIADEACTGLGISGSATGPNAIFNCIANLLLISTGSLSTFTKHLGIVLPKLRTPQTGLSIRSLSHHLTYHKTEVEVMWRNFPWVSIQENTLNILCICWPYTMNNSFFRIEPETFNAVNLLSLIHI